MVLDRPLQIEDEGLEQDEKFGRMQSSREHRSQLPLHFPPPYLPWFEFASKMKAKATSSVLLESHLQLTQGSNPELGSESDPIFETTKHYYGQLDKFTDDIADYQRSGQTILVVTQHGLGRLEEILSESGMGVASSDGIGRGEYPQRGKIYLAQGSLREGWTLDGLNNVDDQPSSLIVITDAELFGSIKERRRNSNRTRGELGREIVLSELIPDSFVVHVDHGVAKFTGTTTMSEDGDDKEYLVLEYADTDKLYVCLLYTSDAADE